MSQAQIYALNILSMDTDTLRDEIINTVKDNPVLIMDDGIYKKKDRPSYGSQKSGDAFKAIMEQKEDTRKSLREHLLHQLNMEKLSDTEKSIGEKLIFNLNPQGHHILEPTTLLEKNNPQENLSTLNKMMHLIQTLDPVGTCTKNVEESLFIQAQENPDSDRLSLFILDGHLDFINPPVPSRSAKKIKSYMDELKILFGLSEKEKNYLTLDYDEETIKSSIDFIKTLNPYPASNFSMEEPHLISPDIFVKEIDQGNSDLINSSEDKLIEKNIVKVENRMWKIQIQNTELPSVSIAPEIKDLLESTDPSAIKNNEELENKIKTAQEFITILENRKSTIEKSALEIVKIQHSFFEKGQGHLVPYRLKDLAKTIGVSESTVSRMANGKYLQYNGSVYPLKYFFENSVSAPKNLSDKINQESTEENQNLSRDNVQLEIKKILEEHKDDKKKLSDQKISDLLEERGIKIARRTVAKYRAQLNIESSYDR